MKLGILLAFQHLLEVNKIFKMAASYWLNRSKKFLVLYPIFLFYLQF